MAMGRTHALSGFAAVLIAAATEGGTGAAHLAGVGIAGVFGMGSALLPDWDHPEGTAAQTFGPVSKRACELIETISLGHRHLTHCLLGVAAFTVPAWFAVKATDLTPAGSWLHRAAVLVVLLMVAALIGTGLRALRVADFERKTFLGWANIAASTLLASIVYLVATPVVELMPWIVALGCLVHIAGDMCTESGCPVLAPFTWRRFWLLPKWLRWSTTDRERFIPEKHLVTPILWLAVGWYGWQVLSASGLFAHFAVTG
jgi:membrane-bound metal-dependent hydrolase YbcI (DUF457 family)